jgi:tetratricopeptide (TPR) repeat protein
MNINNTWKFLVFTIYSTSIMAGSAPWVGTTLNGNPCTGNDQGFGPYDYTNLAHKTDKIGGGGDTALGIVERAHFKPSTENLLKSKFGSFLADFDYTLRAWPNHHKALLSLVRFDLEVRNKIRKPEVIITPVECYFKRAINFSPKDWVTYSIYGHYLRKIGELEKSKSIFENALMIKPGESKLEYSYSLLLIDMKDYEKALEHAKKAYESGNPPDGLKKTLTKLGVWK